MKLCLQSLSSFLSAVWEEGPKLYKAQPERQQLFPDLCSLTFLQTLLGGALFGL